MISSLDEYHKRTSFSSFGWPYMASYVISTISSRVERMVSQIVPWVPPHSALQCSGARHLRFPAVRMLCNLWRGSFWHCSIPFGVIASVHCCLNQCNSSHIIMGYLLMIATIAEETNVLNWSLAAVHSKVLGTESSLLACWPSATTLVSVRNTRVFRTALTALTEPLTLWRRISPYTSPRRRVALHTYLLDFLVTYTHHQNGTCVTLFAVAAVMLKPFTQRLASLGMLLVRLGIIATTYRSTIFKTYAFSLYSPLCIYVSI